DDISSQTYAEEISKSGAAIYNYSGWFDGGYQMAAIKRYLRHQQPDHRLMLGPWDHGGRRRISPYSLGPARFDHAAELIKFFDNHLKDTAPDPDAPPVRYYTMGEEQWKSADHWPPDASSHKLYFQIDSGLATET